MTECVFSGNETGSVECDLTIIPHHCRCDYVSFDPLCSTVSRINYLHFPACSSRDAQIMAMIALGAWAVYLFSALAVIVDHGVVVNLVQISKILRLSEVLAGVTLLALGNGIADIFTAVSAVRSSPNGGALAVSGLLGSALFVISVNTGVLAIKYEPKASRDLLSRDSFFFVISLGWVSYVLWDHSLYAWQAAVLICIYLVYVGTVLAQDVQNQRHWLQASTKHGNAALSQSPSIVASRTTSPASSIHEDFAYESDGSDLVEDPEARLLLGLNGQGSPGSYGTSPVGEDQASPSHGPIVEPVFNVRSSGGGNRAATPSVNDVATRAPPDHTQADSTAAALAARSYVLVSELVPDSMGVRDLFMVEVRRLFPFKSGQPAWKTALVVIQSPVRLLLLCTVPVVQFEAANENSAWNKWLVIFQTICSTTVVAVVVADDAFRAPQHASHKVPLAVFAAVTGILLACLLALTSGQNRLPMCDDPPLRCASRIIHSWFSRFFSAATDIFFLSGASRWRRSSCLPSRTSSLPCYAASDRGLDYRLLFSA
eukprot:m.71389 g.71389  ORF g.71389 m.71389 type:complete len:542 (+) comp10065_c0_seq2:511-2136(+)